MSDLLKTVNYKAIAVKTLRKENPMAERTNDLLLVTDVSSISYKTETSKGTVYFNIPINKIDRNNMKDTVSSTSLIKHIVEVE